jgi:endo-1,4-beta-xylanase
MSENENNYGALNSDADDTDEDVLREDDQDDDDDDDEFQDPAAVLVDGAPAVLTAEARMSSSGLRQSHRRQNSQRSTGSGMHGTNNTTAMNTLRRVAARACKRVDVGTAVLPQPLFTPDAVDYDGIEELRDAAQSIATPYARCIEREFNAIVVEHHLKWSPLCVAEPGPLPDRTPSERLGRYDFYLADSMVDWAVQRNMKVKGHVLVWHVTSPNHLLEEMEPEALRLEIRRHIFTVMGHYRGRISSWDVVNEALAPDGSLADNVFLRKLGPSYIADCFRWAHEADPTVKLLYNDNKVEGIGNPKADGFYNLLADLKHQNVPVHGCGMQAHFNAAGTGVNRPPTPRQVKAQIRRLGDLGLSVNISEMDVRVSQLDNAEIRSKAQTQIFHDICAAALSEPAFDGIWLWGFTDRHTWVTHFYYDDEPLILDENYERKPAYYGLRDALGTLAPGGVIGGNNGRSIFLESDYDQDGKAWGYEWISREPSVTEDGETAPVAGDARPDWEQKSVDDADDEKSNVPTFHDNVPAYNVTDNSVPTGPTDLLA